jgi:hypothetical protein
MEKVARTLVVAMLALSFTPQASAGFWGSVAEPFKTTYKKVIKPVGRDVIVKPSSWMYRKGLKPAWNSMASSDGWGRLSQYGDGAQPAGVQWYYFKLTNPRSRVKPCFVIKVSAKGEEKAKALAHQSALNYSIVEITAAQYFDPNTCKRK